MPTKPEPLTGERLQKVLAGQGLGSRREIERWIEAGRIKLNGQTAELGARCTSADKILLDDKPVRLTGLSKPLVLGLMYYKPEGEVVTRADEQGRTTIFEKLPECDQGRWINVGRLDINTSGLMILTNNGELANRLMHPKYSIVREYAVRVLGDVSEDQVEQMLKGVELEDGKANFESIVDAGGTGRNHWYHVTLREGRNREVRRIWEAMGLQVSRLIRIRFGQIRLDPKMKTGDTRVLTPSELNQLLNETGLPTIEKKKFSKKKRSSAFPAGKPRSSSPYASKPNTSRKKVTTRKPPRKRPGK